MHLWLTASYLVAGGVVAGLLSTIAGMASLVSYPLLLSLGLTPVAANVTNTTAQIFTGIGSTMSAARELKPVKRITAVDTLWALVGSACGSVLLLLAPSATFEAAVPWLIALAGALMLYTLLAKTPQRARTAHPAGKAVALYLVGIYIGYFGASAGMITLSILLLTESLPFATTNAIKNFIAFSGNALAAVIFAFTADIHWAMVWPLGIGFLLGGWLGPRIVRHVPVRPLRFALAALAFGLAGYLAYTTY